MRTRRRKWGRRLLVAGAILLLLENIPGSYRIEDAQDEFDLDSWEGLALLAVEEAELGATLRFDRRVRHRISRNAELVVPAGTTLAARATTRPFVEDGEVVLRPRTAELTADKSLVFIYRGVTIAKARTLRTRPDDEDFGVRVVGRYRVLTALWTAHRYHRQREVRRDYQPPDFAFVDFSARFRANHAVSIPEGPDISTGAEPGHLDIRGARFVNGRWTGGRLDVNLPLANPEAWINDQLAVLALDPVDLGGVFALAIKRVRHLMFSTNRIDLHVDGRLTSANSATVRDVIKPGFTADLVVGVEVTEDVPLREATARVYLERIRGIDLNNSNVLLDKGIRNLARRYRDKAEARFAFAEALDEIPELPRGIHLHWLRVEGSDTQSPVLRLRAGIRPEDEPDYSMTMQSP